MGKKSPPDYQAAGEAAVKTDSGTPSLSWLHDSRLYYLETAEENVEDGLNHILVTHPLFLSPPACTP